MELVVENFQKWELTCVLSVWMRRKNWTAWKAVLRFRVDFFGVVFFVRRWCRLG